MERTNDCNTTSSHQLLVTREGEGHVKPGGAQHCCVPGCTSDSRYWNAEYPVWFHVFPKDLDLRKAWIVEIGRDEGPLFNVS